MPDYEIKCELNAKKEGVQFGCSDSEGKRADCEINVSGDGEGLSMACRGDKELIEKLQRGEKTR